MIADCPTCGGSGRIVYHGESDETDCPDCGGKGRVDVEPEDVGAIKEPEGMSALSDNEIDGWLRTMERLFGKEWLEGGANG